MLPCTGSTWTWPSRGLWSAIRFATSLADREDGTVSLSTVIDLFKTAWYSGYNVLTPPRIGSNGIQGWAFRNSPIPVFCPGRKCGTQCRSVPPFSANDEPLQTSMGGPAIG